MSELYDRLRDTAQRLIKEFGRPVQLVVSTRALSDPAKPWGSDGDTVTTASYSTVGAFMMDGASDLEARLSAVSRLVLSPVEVNEARVFIPAKGLSVEPDASMEIQDGAKTYAIKKVMTVKPGSKAIYYALTLEN